jgi:bidirectional [NiFe] hydrogenase diaphorase subunit
MTVALENKALPEFATDPRLKPVTLAIKRHRARPDSLLEVLHTAQQVFGYLPRALLWHVARQLKLPPSRVFGVATFYHFFSLTPKGEHTCVVCTGTACYIKGAPRLMAALEHDTGLRDGDTAADGSATVQTARCLGACGLAPAVIYDGKIAGHVTPESVVAQVREWGHDGPR